MNALQLCRWQFSHKQTFFKQSAILHRKRPFCVFEQKRGLTAERYERVSVQNRRYRSSGGRLTQNFRQNGSPATNHSYSRKTKLNDLSYGVKIWTDFSSVLSQSTRLTDWRTDRHSDRQTDTFLIASRAGVPCSAEKNWTLSL